MEFFPDLDALAVKKDPVWRNAQAETPVQGPRMVARVGTPVADEDVRYDGPLAGLGEGNNVNLERLGWGEFCYKAGKLSMILKGSRCFLPRDLSLCKLLF
ncbi:MAG: hypothetical protein WAK57_02550 [Desulfobacterales bacterium]